MSAALRDGSEGQAVTVAVPGGTELQVFLEADPVAGFCNPGQGNSTPQFFFCCGGREGLAPKSAPLKTHPRRIFHFFAAPFSNSTAMTKALESIF